MDSILLAQMFPGMAWIPVMLGVTVGGYVSGAVSILTSLFATQSRFARRTGQIALGIGGASPFVFLVLTRNQMFAHASALLATPALGGALGIALARLAPGRRLTALRGVVAVATIVSVSAAGALWIKQRRAGHEMLELLNGSPNVKLVGLQVEHQQRRVLCQDPAICEYFVQAMRFPGLPTGRGGSYLFTFEFASGRVYSAYGSAVETGYTLSIPEANPVELGWDTHMFVYPKPIPSAVDKLITFLTASSDEVAGRVLICDERGTMREELDPTLIPR